MLIADIFYHTFLRKLLLTVAAAILLRMNWWATSADYMVLRLH